LIGKSLGRVNRNVKDEHSEGKPAKVQAQKGGKGKRQKDNSRPVAEAKKGREQGHVLKPLVSQEIQ